MIHESVKLRTASIQNEKGAGYEPWILEHDPEIEPWTHLEDWKNDSAFADAMDNLEALEGWCDTTEARASPGD